MNLIKDFIRTLFGMPDEEPVSDVSTWLFSGIVFLVLIVIVFFR